MLANLRRDTSSITVFLESNTKINRMLDDTMYDIPFLLKLSRNNELAKIVFSSKSEIFIKSKLALDKYIDILQTLLYVDIIGVYMLFNRVEDIAPFVNKLKKLQIKPTIYQLIKDEFQQKMVVIIMDEDTIKQVRPLSGETITIEQTQTFCWEITINDVLYENYNDILESFDKLVKEINCTGKVFLMQPVIKKNHKYCRFNLGSIYERQSIQKTLKSTLQSDNVKPNKTVNKTQSVLTWIGENPPNSDEEKNVYYDRYTESGQSINKSVFTKCIKQLNYVEHKLKNKIYWKKDVKTKSDNEFEIEEYEFISL